MNSENNENYNNDSLNNDNSYNSDNSYNETVNSAPSSGGGYLYDDSAITSAELLTLTN